MSAPDSSSRPSPAAGPTPSPPASPDAAPATAQDLAAQAPPTRWFAYVLVAALFALAGAGLAWWRYDTGPSADDAVPVLLSRSFPDSDGNTIDLARFRGTTLVVNFWATWCVPCVEEMPELSALQGEFSKVGAQVIGIGIDSASNIAEFAHKHQIAYPLVVAGLPGIELAKLFGDGAGALPFTVVIGPDGRVAGRTLGRIDRIRLHELTLHTAQRRRD
jgi:peroxiredoxin